MKILHTNDLHGNLGIIFPALEALRESVDFYFDTGDSVKFGNIAIPLAPDPSWSMLDQLKCTASVLGNREIHYTKKLLQAKLEGANHPILCGNIIDREGDKVFPSTLKLELNGEKVTLIGLMVPMTSRSQKLSFLSEFLWLDPIVECRKILDELVDLGSIIALTHIGLKQDQLLLEQNPAVELVFGGHSHHRIDCPLNFGSGHVMQGGSHGYFAGIYEYQNREIRGGLVRLRDESGKLRDIAEILDETASMFHQGLTWRDEFQ